MVYGVWFWSNWCDVGGGGGWWVCVDCRVVLGFYWKCGVCVDCDDDGDWCWGLVCGGVVVEGVGG